MPLFRRAAPRDPLIIAMSGAALGSRVLILCGDDEKLPVDVAAKVGLSGQAVALARDTAKSNRIARRAEARGVFLEHGVISAPLPQPDDRFDLVIADDRASPGSVTGAALLAESRRVLRPGGRIIVMRTYRRWPWSRRESTDQVHGDLLKALLDAGFRAAREIGAREGISFAEAARSA